MKRLAIEINDAGLVVADERAVIWSEPGCAVVDGRNLLTGSAAFAQSRLKPRSSSSSHWSNLSIEDGSTAVPGVRSTAELAHAQLDRLWKEVGAGVEQVLFIVPSDFGGDAPGILLGLAEECGIPARAIIDVAAAASTRPWPGRQLLHADAGQTGVNVTPIEQGEQAIARAPVKLERMGLAGVMDAFARRIGELFVLATRFDPFHHAETEQELYDRLGGVLAALDEQGRAQVEIGFGGERFEIDVERAQVLGAAQGFYRAVRQLIAQNRQAQSALVVQLGHRLAGLPGLRDELARLDASTIVELGAGQAASAALVAAADLGLDEGDVRFFRRLRWRDAPLESETEAPPRRPETVPAADNEPPPTHIVYLGIAYPINGEGVVIGRSRLDHRRAILIEARTEGVSRAHCELALVDGELTLRDLSSFGTFVNERRIDGVEILKPADIIRVGSPGAELTVVRVENGDGA